MERTQIETNAIRVISVSGKVSKIQHLDLEEKITMASYLEHLLNLLLANCCSRAISLRHAINFSLGPVRNPYWYLVKCFIFFLVLRFFMLDLCGGMFSWIPSCRKPDPYYRHFRRTLDFDEGSELRPEKNER